MMIESNATTGGGSGMMNHKSGYNQIGLNTPVGAAVPRGSTVAASHRLTSDSSLSDELVEFAAVAQPLVKPAGNGGGGMGNATSITMPGGGLQQKRKKRRKKHYRVLGGAHDPSRGVGGAMSPLCCCCGGSGSPGGSPGGPTSSVCWTLTQVVTQLFCLVAVLALIFWSYHIRGQMDILDQYFTSVKAGNKNYDQDVVDVKTRLGGAEKSLRNIESGAGGLDEINRKLSDLIAQIKALNTTTSQLQSSIAAAPEIRDLPNSVKALQQGVASQGSSVLSLQGEIKQLHQASKISTTDREHINEQINQLWVTVNGSLVSQESTSAVTDNIHTSSQQQQQLYQIVNTSVQSVNTSLWSVLQEVIDKQQVTMSNVANVTRMLQSFTSLPTQNPLEGYNSDSGGGGSKRVMDELLYNISHINTRLSHLESDLNRDNILNADTQRGLNDIITETVNTWSEKQGVQYLRDSLQSLGDRVDHLEGRLNSTQSPAKSL